MPIWNDRFVTHYGPQGDDLGAAAKGRVQTLSSQRATEAPRPAEAGQNRPVEKLENHPSIREAWPII